MPLMHEEFFADYEPKANDQTFEWPTQADIEAMAEKPGDLRLEEFWL